MYIVSIAKVEISRFPLLTCIIASFGTFIEYNIFRIKTNWGIIKIIIIIK